LPVVMNMLVQASSTTVDPNDYDMVDYLNDLREGIFEAHTGILQALATDKIADPHFLPYVQPLGVFVTVVAQDNSRSDAVSKVCVGVLGDLASALGAKVAPVFQNPVIGQFVKDMCKSQNQSVKDTAKWAKDIIAKLS